MNHYLSFLVLPFAALFGSFVSKKVKEGHSILLVFISSLFVTTIWIWTLRTTKWNLAITSLIFDSVMSIGYFIGFLCMGDNLTSLQWIGALLTICGMILLGM